MKQNNREEIITLLSVLSDHRDDKLRLGRLISIKKIVDLAGVHAQINAQRNSTLLTRGRNESYLCFIERVADAALNAMVDLSREEQNST